MTRRTIVLGALFALAACEQDPQTLPFEPEAAVTRTVTSAGGSISTPAGAAVVFPSGSVPGSVEVTLAAASVPQEAQRSGTPASEAFRLEPVGQELAEPAELELKFAPGTDPTRSWLASVVSVVDGEVRQYGSSRVDLSTGVVTASIDQLAVVTVVIPPANAIFPVQLGAAAALLPMPRPSLAVIPRRITVSCASPENPCTGLTVSATQNLLDQVQEAAVVYPTIEGGFEIEGGKATGTIRARASLRIKLQSGQTAESVEVNALLEANGSTVTETASELRFENVRFRISGAQESGTETREEIGTLVVPIDGTGGSIAVDRSFEIRTTGGGLEPARVVLTFPVTIQP